MARIVKVEDQTPLIITSEQIAGGPCAVCRCGLSGQWPMCDGTHKATKGEEPGKLYHYTRELPQGNVTRAEVGELEWPGGRKGGHKQAEASAHQGDGARRGQRPEQAKGSTKGPEAGEEPEAETAQAGEDELVAGGAAEVTPGALATGGAERVVGQNRDRIKVKGSSQDEPSQAI